MQDAEVGEEIVHVCKAPLRQLASAKTEWVTDDTVASGTVRSLKGFSATRTTTRPGGGGSGGSARSYCGPEDDRDNGFGCHCAQSGSESRCEHQRQHTDLATDEGVKSARVIGGDNRRKSHKNTFLKVRSSC